MTELASAGQLRAAFLRWALVLVPGVLLLGMLSGAMAGSVATNPWFATLAKPAIYPPPATFGIVWSLLYLMMGLALTMVVVAWGAAGRGVAITLFAVQLVLNLLWSPLFFAFHRIAAALVLLGAIDLAVAATLLAFWRVRRGAGLLLVPYLAWVLFATVLNWQFLQLNQSADGAASGPVRIEFKP
ncbi:MAG: tryptophan-rich sensory protein [Proteobacteria bacterium]|nr:tryptophan-rich sensory protein [Pseudomonadota bacterium]